MEPLPASGRSGVLVARAWRDPAADEVRVRLLWSADVGREATQCAVTDAREAVVTAVLAWLARVGDIEP